MEKQVLNLDTLRNTKKNTRKRKFMLASYKVILSQRKFEFIV